MGFEIDVNIGSGQIVTMRGVKNGTIELCNTVDMKVKDSEEKIPTLVGFAFFTSLESAINAVMKFRVARSDARSLEELKHVVIRENKKLKGMFEGWVESTEEVEDIHDTPKPVRKRPLRTAKEPVKEDPPASSTPPKRKENPARAARRLAAQSDVEETIKRKRKLNNTSLPEESEPTSSRRRKPIRRK